MDDERPLESRRELENLRQRYQEHRRTVRHLLQTAPDAHLASSYEATLNELQRAIEQLDRVDRLEPATIRSGEEEFDPNATRSVKPGITALPGLDTISVKKSPSFDDTELSTEGRTWNDPVVRDDSKGPVRGNSGSDVTPWIVGILVLAVIVFGIWFFWPDGEPAEDEGVVPADSEVVEEVPAAEPPPPPGLIAEPSTYDYGIIGKGTRSVHRFAIRNQTDQGLPIEVSRSQCRCLWYDYPPQIDAGGSVELAITVDGARAEAGTLSESVTVTSAALPDAVAEIDLTAEIRER